MPDESPYSLTNPIGTGGASTAGTPIGPAGEVFTGGGPIGSSGAPGSGGAFIAAPGVPPAASALTATPAEMVGGAPVGGAASKFNIGGAPIAVLGGVFSGGLPLAGPVTQIFRGGSAPLPPTLFVATISPSGPISAFFIGSGGAPIGVDTFRGGGLPIGPPEAVAVQVANIEPRTSLVGPPAVAFGGGGGAPAFSPPIGEPTSTL